MLGQQRIYLEKGLYDDIFISGKCVYSHLQRPSRPLYWLLHLWEPLPLRCRQSQAQRLERPRAGPMRWVLHDRIFVEYILPLICLFCRGSLLRFGSSAGEAEICLPCWKTVVGEARYHLVTLYLRFTHAGKLTAVSWTIYCTWVITSYSKTTMISRRCLDRSRPSISPTGNPGARKR